MAAKLRATWALLFWPTCSAAVDRALLLDERSLKQDFENPLEILQLCYLKCCMLSIDVFRHADHWFYPGRG